MRFACNHQWPEMNMAWLECATHIHYQRKIIMAKTIANLTITLMAVTLVGACTGFQKQGPPTSYDGTGDIVEYHSNGSLKRKAEYLNGELVSVVGFYPSGAEEFDEHYTMGELQDATYYFASGRVRAEVGGK
jgi:hypothetical protein